MSDELMLPDDPIHAALERAQDTEDVVIGPGALGSVDEVVRRVVGDRPVTVVADEHTWRVAGKQVHDQLHAAGAASGEAFLFPAGEVVRAEYGNVERVREALAGRDTVAVAVGAGSLNDLVKRASHELGRPYVVVATAASMDGYTAFGAALTRGGYKQTMTCPAPLALVADLDVLAAAPAGMTASGYGDLLGKVTAGADWLVADELGVESIDPTVWSLVQGPLKEAVGRPGALAAGDPAALAGLVEGLVMSGLAMQAHASSRPASGAEHQFSHLWEMEGLGADQRPPLSHGFKVGVGSIAVAALYERLLDRDLAAVDIDALVAGWPTVEQVAHDVEAVHPVDGVRTAAVAESLAKHAAPEQLAERLERVRGSWSSLRERLVGQLLPAAELAEMLRAAGAPSRPAEIGVSPEVLRDTYFRCRTIRRRYTVLDLAAETGLLEPCVDELFAPGGFWSR
jgi:glycerol-1-phosphate dehydrogenase [NAD(P)+]